MIGKKSPNSNNLYAVDFFCGGGGMSYGIGQSGIDVIAGIDSDVRCKETYEKNHPKSIFINEDIGQIVPEDLIKLIGIKKEDDNAVFIGCSPCQYWSLIKTDKRKSEKTKNLINDFKRFVDFFSPGYVVIENVPGLLKNTKESPLGKFVSFLKEKKYVVSSDIINSNDYGVPQNRKRFLLIASRTKGKISLPEQDTGSKAIVRDFIGIKNGFARIEPGNKDESEFLHTTAELSKTNIRRLRKTPKNGGSRLSWKNDPELQLSAYIGKDDCFSDVYGRLFWNKPAPTITTRFLHTSNGRFAHPEENRGLSIREGATLQTFPFDYQFCSGSQETIARIIGNAVPPKLAEAIGKTLKRHYSNG